MPGSYQYTARINTNGGPIDYTPMEGQLICEPPSFQCKYQLPSTNTSPKTLAMTTTMPPLQTQVSTWDWTNMEPLYIQTACKDGGYKRYQTGCIIRRRMVPVWFSVEYKVCPTGPQTQYRETTFLASKLIPACHWETCTLAPSIASVSNGVNGLLTNGVNGKLTNGVNGKLTNGELWIDDDTRETKLKNYRSEVVFQVNIPSQVALKPCKVQNGPFFSSNSRSEIRI
ncbi:unnamed protein product [Cyprideis torosa]|uniref:Uncharacterized protein n=1 Tax=Cyprideis torosa TaxID=163714 RepID=A0A7R8ZM76_9CRUS|nr:unnamed protein product [Cyprideis torosa]CAG0893569.1 unnamed protein product [Cyprideis torosa]